MVGFERLYITQAFAIVTLVRRARTQLLEFVYCGPEPEGIQFLDVSYRVLSFLSASITVVQC
jgi:hypothetical protein